MWLSALEYYYDVNAASVFTELLVISISAPPLR
ncbi:MAG: hypothetical protein R3E95_11015 [Thiolinea sp.]